MKRINRNIGAKVEVREVNIAINPKDKWKNLKKVKGTIVKNEGYEQYYLTCSGAYTHVNKHIIKNDCYSTYAIKLDNGVTDVLGNNIIVVREYDLKFLERIEIGRKPVTEKAYRNAKKIIERYELENK